MDRAVAEARMPFAVTPPPANDAASDTHVTAWNRPRSVGWRNPLAASHPLRWLAGALLIMVLLVAQIPGQVLVADYQFQGNLESVEFGAPPLMPLGNSHFTNDLVDGLSRTVMYFPAGGGLMLTNADVLLAPGYSIAILFRLNSRGGWHRLMDFKNQSTDWGLYNFYDNLSFFNLAAGTGGSVPPDSYVQVVLTRSFTDEVTGYVNGNRDIIFADPAGEAFLGREGILSFFRDDLQYPDENAAGTVARLRIYFGDLSVAEVAALDRLPGATHRQKPSLTSASKAEGAVSLPFRFQIRAANGPDSFSATGLPEWASLNHTTGEITGTPPTVGFHLVGVSACNAAGCDAQTLTLNITDFTLSAEPGADRLRLIIEGPTGNRYSVEHAEAVPPSTEWSVLTNFTATETRSIILDPSATNAPQRFYRALRLP